MSPKTELDRDERAWLLVTPASVPYFAHAVINGWQLAIGQADRSSPRECPRCRFDSVISLPLTARKQIGAFGIFATTLTTLYACPRCLDQQ